MPDLTSYEKIEVMKLAVDAGCNARPEAFPKPQILSIYHAMIKAITTLEDQAIVSGPSPTVAPIEVPNNWVLGA